MTRKSWIAAMLVALVAVAAAVPAFAQEGGAAEPQQSMKRHHVPFGQLVTALAELSGETPGTITQMLQSGKRLGQVIEELGLDPAAVREALRGARKPPRQAQRPGPAPGLDRGALLGVLAELSGQSPEAIVEMAKSGLTLQQIVEQLGLDPAEVRAKLAELAGPKHRPMPEANKRRIAVAVLADLSGQSAESIIELLQSGQSLEQVLQSLGVTPEAFQAALQAARAEAGEVLKEKRDELKERREQLQQKRAEQARHLAEVFAAISGASVDEILALFESGKGPAAVMQELGITPEQVREYRQQNRPQAPTNTSNSI